MTIDNVDLGKLPPDGKAGQIYTLTIRGKLKPATIEESRKIHNATAGDPGGVAACRSLGDLSHNVFVPVNEKDPREILIVDTWTSIAGLGQFFSDPQVQQGGGQIFVERDPVVWVAAPNVISYHLPTPKSRTEMVLGVLRATVKSRDEASKTWDGILKSTLNAARLHGHYAQRVYFRATAPNEPPSNEILGMAMWSDVERMETFYKSGFMAGFGNIFTGPPTTSIWKPAPGEWTEW